MRKQKERTTRPVVEIIYCPKCKDQAMLLVAAKPLLFAAGVEEIHYRCRECDAQELRIVKPTRH